jgi:hypothetical protein
VRPSSRKSDGILLSSRWTHTWADLTWRFRVAGALLGAGLIALVLVFVVAGRDASVASGASEAIVPVQSATTNYGSAASSTSVTLSSNVTAGDALVLAVSTSTPSGATAAVSSVTGGGVTWQRGSSGGDATVGDLEIWYGTASSGGSGTETISVTLSNANAEVGAWVGEFSGVASASALDASGATTGSGKTISAPAMTADATGDLVVDAVNSDAIPTSGPAAPWTDPTGGSGSAFNPIAYRTLPSSGTIPVATWPQASSAWATVGIALTPGVAYATGPYTYTYSYNAAGELTGVNG